MNRIICKILTSLSLVTLASACSGGDSTVDQADKIDRAINEGNLTAAQRECDRYFSVRPVLDSLTVPELCHMAVVLASLAENSDDRRDENAAQAVLCYRTALERDSAATTSYLQALSTDEYRHIYLLNQLLRPITDREDGVIYTSDEDEWNEHISNSAITD